MNPKQTGDQEAGRPTSLFDCALLVGCFVPILAVFGLVAWGTATLLHWPLHSPMWLGVPIGIAAGALVILVLKLANYDNWVELSWTCIIIVIVAAFVMPILWQARKVRLQRVKQERSAISTGEGARYEARPPGSTRRGTGRWRPGE